MQEVRDIMSGKVEPERCPSLSALMDDLDAEDANA
jgi:relB/dinJ family addiction module antitoxin